MTVILYLFILSAFTGLRLKVTGQKTKGSSVRNFQVDTEQSASLIETLTDTCRWLLPIKSFIYNHFQTSSLQISESCLLRPRFELKINTFAEVTQTTVQYTVV